MRLNGIGHSGHREENQSLLRAPPLRTSGPRAQKLREWKDVEAFEVKLKPEGYRAFPRRPFVMPCRALCGLDLKRVHFTCMFCRLRRVFAGKMTARNDCHTYSLIIMDHRPLATVKDLLLRKFVLPIAEALAN